MRAYTIMCTRGGNEYRSLVARYKHASRIVTCCWLLSQLLLLSVIHMHHVTFRLNAPVTYRGSYWYRSIGGIGTIFGIGIADTLSPDTSILRYLNFCLFWAQKWTNLDDFCVQQYSFLPCKVEWCVSHWTYQGWHEYGILTMAPWISSCNIWNFYGNL